jgi:hypothetical protein
MFALRHKFSCRDRVVSLFFCCLPFELTLKVIQGSFSGSQKSKAKSLKLLKSILTSMQSWFYFRTRPLSLSTLTHALPSSLNCLTANQEIGEVSNIGDLFTVNSPWSNGKSEPAERRVLLLLLVYVS